ncbi:MAG: hypothetical protein GXO02_02675, partial [Epsilonproteobacteria bacterium]|nr:hypothetical protein [Campylobacterota bacterium]
MEKLNRIEKLKVKLHPISYPLEEFLKSSKEPTKEDEFFLKNFGIYYSPLRENRYMIRLRVDGGRIDISWLEVIIEILEKFKINAIATARSQIELHNIKRENLLEIYSILQKNNLTSYQTLTDNIRAIITDPLDGFTKSSYFEAFEIIKEISKEIIKNPDLFGMLPRKFNCAIIAQEDVLFNFWNNDLLFAIAKKDGKIGFNLYGGGKFNESAKSLNIFIPKEMAKELFFKIIYYYLEYGSRGTRSKNRFYFLLEKINFNLKEELQKKFNL